MSVLNALTDAIRDGSVEVIDLTAPLSAETPIIQLPEPFGNTARFGLTEISHYDERGPAWYWNDIVTGEHTGTHFDAPVHWVTGKDREDVAQVPVSRLIAPAVVLDFSAEAAADPDFLLEIDHVKAWEAANGPLPVDGWMLYRTGWDARSSDQAAFLNANETGPHTPGISISCATWLAEAAAGSTMAAPRPATTALPISARRLSDRAICGARRPRPGVHSPGLCPDPLVQVESTIMTSRWVTSLLRVNEPIVSSAGGQVENALQDAGDDASWDTWPLRPVWPV